MSATVSSSFSAVRQTTCTPGPAAMRASKAKPTNAMTSRRWSFDSDIGDTNRIVSVTYQSIYESPAGEIQLGCH